MFLTIRYITKPGLFANNRGQGSGNAQVLQYVCSENDTRSIISGYSIAYAIRNNMERFGANTARKTVGNVNGEYEYGPNRVAKLQDFFSTSTNPYDYPDLLLRGWFSAPKSEKGSKGTKVSTGSGVEASTSDNDAIVVIKEEPVDDSKVSKCKGALQLDCPISTTPYDGDVVFTRGLKSDGGLNPFTYQRHYTRYSGCMSFDLLSMMNFKTPIGVSKNDRERICKDAVVLAIKAFMSGLQVGGNHTSNASEFVPATIIYRIHKGAGQSGLYLPPWILNQFQPDVEIDSERIQGVMSYLDSILGEEEYNIIGEGTPDPICNLQDLYADIDSAFANV